MTYLRIAILLVLALAIGSGCGGRREDKWTQGRPPVYPTWGQVLLDGEPVPGATVTFQPVDEGGRGGSARTDSSGNFKAQTFEEGDGLTAGTHRVAVRKTELVDREGNVVEVIREPGSVKEVHRLPEKYADFQKSGLEVTVEVAKGNDLGQINLSK